MNTVLKQELQAIDHLSVDITDNLVVYILPAHMKTEFPAVIEAIGLMRKEAFSEKGAGGTGRLDLDPFDEYYHQMFVMKTNSMEMVAGYRFFIHRSSDTHSLDMHRLFNMDKLLSVKENLPSIELGRSFIIPKYQKYAAVFYSLFSGLGVIVNLVPDTRYLFGKITFYPGNSHNGEVLRFLELYHHDSSSLVSAKEEVHIPTSLDFTGLSYRKALNKVKDYMPEILKIYLKLTSPHYAVVSGTTPNQEFGEGVMETAFRIYYPEITEFWLNRFVYPCREGAACISVPWE